MYYTMCTVGRRRVLLHDVVQLYMWRSSRYLLKVYTPSELLTNYTYTRSRTLAGAYTLLHAVHTYT